MIIAPTATVAILYILKNIQFNFMMSSHFKYTVRNYQEKYKSVYQLEKFEESAEKKYDEKALDEASKEGIKLKQAFADL
jgi:hypothetical protein